MSTDFLYPIIVSNAVSVPTEAGQKAGGLAILMGDSFKAGKWFGWDRRIQQNPNPFDTVYHEGEKTFITTALSPDQEEYFYNTMSTRVISLLCHGIHVPLEKKVLKLALEFYKEFSEITADKVFEGIISSNRPVDLVWVHDFHLFGLAEDLKNRGVDQPIGFFLHVPFPKYEALLKLDKDVRHETFGKMRFCDQIGFHTQDYLDNFTEFMVADYKAKRTFDSSLVVNGHYIKLSVARADINLKKWRYTGLTPIPQKLKPAFNAAEGRQKLLGYGRMDRTKGWLLTGEVVEALYEQFPEAVESIVPYVVAPDSRLGVPEYAHYGHITDQKFAYINQTYTRNPARPAAILERITYTHEMIKAVIQNGGVGIAPSESEGYGMTLDEIIAAGNPNGPMAVMAGNNVGAAKTKKGIVTFDPNNVSDYLSQLKFCIKMPMDERINRWQAAYSTLRDTGDWWDNNIQAILDTKRDRVAPRHHANYGLAQVLPS